MTIQLNATHDPARSNWVGRKICVAHGGVYIPGYWGRMDHGWRGRTDCAEHCRREPSSYMRKLWFDTLVFDRDEAQLGDLAKAKSLA